MDRQAFGGNAHCFVVMVLAADGVWSSAGVEICKVIGRGRDLEDVSSACGRGRDGPSSVVRPPAALRAAMAPSGPGPKSTGLMGTLEGFPNPPATEFVGQSPPTSTR